MKFKVQNKELMRGLSFVQKAITGKTTMPILSGVLIVAKGNELTLKGSDLTTTIIATCEADIEKEGSIIIDGKLLSEMKKFPEGDLNFEKLDDNFIIVKAGRLKAKLPILGDSMAFPDTTSIKEVGNFEISVEKLKEMVKTTSFAAAIDETRPILTGLLFQCKDKKFNIVGLDGYRLSINSTDLDNDDFEIIVPSKSISDLVKSLEEGNVLVSYDTSNVIFKFDNITMQTRLLEGKYVNYSSLLPQDNDIKLEIDNLKFKEVIQRCIIADREQCLIKLEIGKTILKLKSESQLGIIEEEIDCISNKELAICFNSKYLLDVCNNLNGNLVFTFKNAVSPCLVSRKDDDDVKQLILPVRLMR